MSPDGPIQKEVAAWQAGAFSDRDFLGRLIERITPENVEEVFEQPGEIISMIADEVAQAPTTEQEWRGAFITESNCGTETAEDRKARHAIQLRNFRRGIETLRDRLNTKKESNG